MGACDGYRNPMSAVIRITARDIERYERMGAFEARLREAGYRFIAGVDEAGRGPLAGPVVAAACILPEGVNFHGLNDSKKMTVKRREALEILIREKAVAWSVAMVGESEIDRVNILEATKEAMRRALCELSCSPDIALIDAVTLQGFDYPCRALVKGDAEHNVIAAASVLAKVARDRMMVRWDEEFPGYGFASHKGYGTAEHIRAIEEQGPCPIHRLSFLSNILKP